MTKKQRSAAAKKGWVTRRLREVGHKLPWVIVPRASDRGYSDSVYTRHEYRSRITNN